MSEIRRPKCPKCPKCRGVAARAVRFVEHWTRPWTTMDAGPDGFPNPDTKVHHETVRDFVTAECANGHEWVPRGVRQLADLLKPRPDEPGSGHVQGATKP